MSNKCKYDLWEAKNVRVISQSELENFFKKNSDLFKEMAEHLNLKPQLMPLKVAKSKSKKAINAAVVANIHELVHKGTMQRPMKQIIAIAESAARKGKGGKRLMKKK